MEVMQGNKIVLEQTDTITAKSDVAGSLDVAQLFWRLDMGLTKISGGVIQSDNFSVGVITATSVNTSGVVTAATVQIGAATTVHTDLLIVGSGNITSHNINSTGII